LYGLQRLEQHSNGPRLTGDETFDLLPATREVDPFDALGQQFGKDRLVKRDDVETAPRSRLVADGGRDEVFVDLEQHLAVGQLNQERMIGRGVLEDFVRDAAIDLPRAPVSPKTGSHVPGVDLGGDGPMVGEHVQVLDIGVGTEAHDRVVGARGPLFARIGEGGFVTVMPVGDDQGAGPHRVGQHVDLRRRRDDPQAMQCAVVVGEARRGRAAFEGVEIGREVSSAAVDGIDG
jgi:hypothetical protein